MESVKKFIKETSNKALAGGATIAGTIIAGVVAAIIMQGGDEVETVVQEVTHAPTATLVPPTSQPQLEPNITIIINNEEKPEWTPIPEPVQPTIAPVEIETSPTPSILQPIATPSTQPTTQAISMGKTPTATIVIQQDSTIGKDMQTDSEMPSPIAATVSPPEESSPTPASMPSPSTPPTVSAQPSIPAVEKSSSTPAATATATPTMTSTPTAEPTATEIPTPTSTEIPVPTNPVFDPNLKENLWCHDPDGYDFGQDYDYSKESAIPLLQLIEAHNLNDQSIQAVLHHISDGLSIGPMFCNDVEEGGFEVFLPPHIYNNFEQGFEYCTPNSPEVDVINVWDAAQELYGSRDDVKKLFSQVERDGQIIYCGNWQDIGDDRSVSVEYLNQLLAQQ